VNELIRDTGTPLLETLWEIMPRVADPCRELGLIASLGNVANGHAYSLNGRPDLRRDATE
jgi:hypothetical protein